MPTYLALGDNMSIEYLCFQIEATLADAKVIAGLFRAEYKN